MWNTSDPVVVGIDGSDAAMNAALWAIDEAISRDVPLQIVHVTHIEEQTAPEKGRFRLDVQDAESALRVAKAAVEATGKHVKVETEILWGSIETALINESRNAAMVCLGSVGIGFVASKVLGSTAATVAEDAYCPVAVIRAPHDTQAGSHDSIAVVVEDRADNDSVIEHAMEEARLRNAPVLAVGVWREDLGEEPYANLDRRLDTWRQRYHDVDVYPVTTRAGIARYLTEDSAEPVQLAVVGRADASSVAEIIGAHRHAIAAHGGCSVLVVR